MRRAPCPYHLPTFPPFARPSGWRAGRGWEEEGKGGRRTGRAKSTHALAGRSIEGDDPNQTKERKSTDWSLTVEKGGRMRPFGHPLTHPRFIH